MSAERRSFRLRYVGDRFEGGRLPVDVLDDLVAFREILAAFARMRWRLDNPKRRRLPRGFDQSISLDLVGIENGSTIPRLELRRIDGEPTLPFMSDAMNEYVDLAYRDFLRLIDGEDGPPRALDSADLVRQLNRFGSGLRPGERIEFDHHGDRERPFYIDSVKRRTMITKLASTYNRTFRGTGRLVGLHLQGEISVETEEYGEIRIKVDGARVKAEFDGNTGADVQIETTLELDDHDRLRSVVDVVHVELVESVAAEVEDRLAELSSLPAGWHDGEGDAVTPLAVENVRRFVRRRPDLAPHLHIYPTLLGGLHLEFVMAGWDLTLDVAPTGAVELFGVGVDEGRDGAEIEPRSFDAVDATLLDFLDTITGAADGG